MTERSTTICLLVALPGLLALAASLGLLLFVVGLGLRDRIRWWLQYRRHDDGG